MNETISFEAKDREKHDALMNGTLVVDEDKKWVLDEVRKFLSVYQDSVTGYTIDAKAGQIPILKVEMVIRTSDGIVRVV